MGWEIKAKLLALSLLIARSAYFMRERERERVGVVRREDESGF